ncbi:MAG: dihydrodipicolinate reductase C-terminal domain-containing protein [Clostridia bacterium]|nr:dihydrodipicolinate reductase C-terminal domain-containing protein [Clostridia bacterium]
MKAIIFGIMGKMGRCVAECLEQSGDRVSAGVDKRATAISVRGAHTADIIPIYTSWQDIYEEFDVVIDFSSPELSLAAVEFASLNNAPLVIGTTGHTEEQKQQIYQADLKYLCFLPNMSLGIDLIGKLCDDIRPRIKDNFCCSIIEKHYAGKKDAPSGTALSLSDKLGTVDIVSIRIGAAIGEHTILLENDFETIEIKHTAHNRKAFALGAVTQAKALLQRKTLDLGLRTSE